MPIQLLLAPANGGKTTHLLQLAQATAVHLQAQVYICVPTSLQQHAWRQRLANSGGSIGIHVHTFESLVATCLDQAGTAYTKLSEPVLYRLLRQVIDQQPLHHYAPIRHKPGFIQMVHQFITELKSAAIYPEQFAQAIEQLGAGARLHELATIYTAYQQQLQSHQWADRVGLHWLAADILSSHPTAVGHWPLLIIDGFDDFTPTHLALFRQLAQRATHCVLTLPQAEKTHYPRYQKSLATISKTFGISGTVLPTTAVANPTNLQWLNQRLFSPQASPPQTADGRITLQEWPTTAAEIRAALRWLKQQIVQNGRRPDELALIARDLAPYRPFIQQIGQEFGLPLHIASGYPLSQSPVMAALQTLMQLYLPTAAKQTVALPRRQLLSTWRSPYFAWGDHPHAVRPGDADTLDLLARQQRVIRGLGQWQEAFATAVAATDLPTLDDEAEASGHPLPNDVVQQLQHTFHYFLQQTAPPPSATIRDFVEWLEALIGPDPQMRGQTAVAGNSLHIVAQAHANPPTAVADVAALQTLKDILRGLVWAEEATNQNRTVSFAYFFNELTGAIAATDFQLPTEANQPRLLVATVQQMRGLSFTAVAVVGLSEGAFPATLTEDPILPNSDRQQLTQRFGFPLKPSPLSGEQEYFYEAVTRARDQLLLTRPLLAENGAEWLPSPFWEEVRRLIDIQPENWASEANLPADQTASWAEWWEAIATDPDPATTACYPETWQQLQQAAAIWHGRVHQQTAVYNGDLSSLQHSLQAHFNADHIWSASRLEAYQTCGFYFFLQHLLNVEARPEPSEGLDARQLGNLYHQLLEAVSNQAQADTFALDEDMFREWVATISEPILNEAPAKLGFRQTAWWGQTRNEIISNVAHTMRSLQHDQYHFYRAEVAFGLDGQPPLQLHRPGDTLQLRGVIDRIDRTTDGRLRIVDYKTSHSGSYARPAIEQGKKLQLPLYAQAAQETLALGEVDDGMYWHFREGKASTFTLANNLAAIGTAVEHSWHAVDQIRHGRFQPRPPAGGCPAYCPAVDFCWQYKPGSR